MRKQNENQTNVLEGAEWYRKKIVEMVEQIENEKFLNQIYTILKRHVQKRGR